MSLALQDLGLARRVGAATLVVITLAIVFFVFILDRIALGSPTHIRVVFRHTAGLREHAPLVVAGQPVGRIEAITPVPHGAGGALAGEVGVAVHVAIDEDAAWKVPARAEIFVASRGPLSDRYLEVAPPLGEPGPGVREGEELRGVDPPSLDSVLRRTWNNLTTFQQFAETVRPELASLRAQLDELRGRLDELDADTRATGGAGALVDATRELVESARHTHGVSLGGQPGLARLGATLDAARATVAELRAAIDALGPDARAIAANLTSVRGHHAASEPIARVERTIATVRAAVDRLALLVADIDELRQRIASGDGSLLRIIRDPEFPEDAKDIGKVLKRHPWRLLERPGN